MNTKYLFPLFLRLVLLLLLVSGLGVSCVDPAYDFKNTDTDAVIACDGISAPLGNTRQFTVESLFGEYLGDYISKKADGSYFIQYDAPKISANVSEIGNINVPLSFDSDSDYFNTSVFLFAKPDIDLSKYPEDNVALFGYMSPIIPILRHTEKIHVRIDDIPEEIVALSDMTLSDGAALKVSVSIPDCLLTKGTIAPDVKVDVSQLLNLSEATDNILRINDISLSPENNYSDVSYYPLKGIFFDPDAFSATDHTLDIDADIQISGSFQIISPATTHARYQAAPAQNELLVKIELTDASIASVTGAFDYRTPPFDYTYNIGEFTGQLNSENAVLDFADPAIVLDIQGALGISVNAYLSVTGLKNGVPVSVEPLETMVDLPNKDGALSKTVRIAKDGDIPYDLSALMRANPDALHFRAYAETDRSQTGTISKDGNYWLDVMPQIEIPLSFGPNLYLNFRDTILLPTTVGQILRDNAVMLSGEMIHTLPLNLIFGFVMTDNDGNPMTSPATTPEITTGKRTVFELSQKATSRSAAEKISKAIMTFTLTASDSGAALNANQTIQLDNLAIALPEGYHLPSLQ